MKIHTFPRSAFHIETVETAIKTREEALTRKELKEIEKEMEDSNEPTTASPEKAESNDAGTKVKKKA